MDYVVKAVIFGVFLALVYYVSDYFLTLLKNALSDVGFSAVFCQFGIYKGLQAFMSIVLTAFAFKQVLGFLK